MKKKTTLDWLNARFIYSSLFVKINRLEEYYTGIID